MIKHDRLEKILLSATKQSLRFHTPELKELQSFDDFIELEELSKDQAEYIGVTVEGPFKPEYYRY